MVTVPAPLVVERDDEEVLPLQPLKHLLPSITAGERIAQSGTHALQHGRLEQELTHPFGLPFEDLLGQEVQDVAVAPGEGLDEAGEVLAVAHREGRKLEGGD